MQLGLAAIAPVRKARGVGPAVPDSTGQIYTLTGLKPGSPATLFGNGAPLAETTVSNAGKATWTLPGKPSSRTLITWDGIVSGPGAVASVGVVPTRLITLPGPNFQKPLFDPTEFLDVIVGTDPRDRGIEPTGLGGSGRVRDGLLSGHPLNIAGDFDRLILSNLKTDATDRASVDGIRNNAVSLKSLLISHCRIVGIVGTSTGNHADAFQQTDLGSADEIVIEDCTIGTAFQALIIKYLENGVGCPRLVLRRVNIFNERALRLARGQPLSTAIVVVGRGPKPVEVIIEDCYIEDWPGADDYIASFQGDCIVTGAFIRGRPPGGDYCPA